MDRRYDQETGNHELSLSSGELELVYRGLKALAGIALLQSSVDGPTINADLLSEMRAYVDEEGL